MINILFCGDSNAYDGILISTLSILKNTKDSLNIYVLTADLSNIDKKFKPIEDTQIEVIEGVLKKSNSNNTIKLIDISKLFDDEMLNSINLNTSYTPYIFLRLFADQIPELPNKLLYLDADTVCYKDLSELFNIDVSDYEFAASRDYIGRWFIDYNYLNSGVLLLNLENMKKNDSFTNCRKMCIEKRLLLPDQTALNACCKNKLYLPRKFNEQKERKDDTVIRHFSMTIKLIPFKKINIKPWHIDKIHDVYGIHDFDDILDEYLKIKKGEEENETINTNIFCN